MPLDLIIFVAALIVAWLAFNWLLKVVKTTLSTAIAIAAIVLVLMLFFGVQPGELWQQITQLPQTIWNTITGGGK